MIEFINLPPELHRNISNYLLNLDLVALIQTSKDVRSMFESVLQGRRLKPSNLFKELKEQNYGQEQRLQSADLLRDLSDLLSKTTFFVFVFDCVSSKRAESLVRYAMKNFGGKFSLYASWMSRDSGSEQLDKITTVVLILWTKMGGDLAVQQNTLKTLQRRTKTFFCDQLVEAKPKDWITKRAEVLNKMAGDPFHLAFRRLPKPQPLAMTRDGHIVLQSHLPELSLSQALQDLQDSAAGGVEAAWASQSGLDFTELISVEQRL
ncbi:hypothetical protein EDB80DRAFT_733877 [Ilyonectria destructans]|nr:hypothetical protein EDB80DRAFT_733877 [Ilyonectria destructans]